MTFTNLQEEVESMFGECQLDFGRVCSDKEMFDYLAINESNDKAVVVGRISRHGYHVVSITSMGNMVPVRPEGRDQPSGRLGCAANPARKAYKKALAMKSADEDARTRLLAGERPPWCMHGRGRPPATWIRVAATLGIILTAPAAAQKAAA
jgi:hypothetical protein